MMLFGETEFIIDETGRCSLRRSAGAGAYFRTFNPNFLDTLLNACRYVRATVEETEMIFEAVEAGIYHMSPKERCRYLSKFRWIE